MFASLQKTSFGPKAPPLRQTQHLPRSSAPVLQRTSSCACGGGCPRCQTGSNLKISAPDDRYERKADRIVDHVVRMPGPNGASSGPLRRKEATVRTNPDSRISKGRPRPPAALCSSHRPQPVRSPSGAGLLLQRKCACGAGTTSLTGECAGCTSKEHLQTKLAIGASNDPLELEADRVADQVLSAPAEPTASGAPPLVQRLAGHSAATTCIAPASVDHVLAASGRPLEPVLRRDFEQRLGHDFSQVRVHIGEAAEQSARDVSAHAYTVGQSIVFGAGQFVPSSHKGRRLIAHELVHTIQQGTGAPSARRIEAEAIPSAHSASSAVLGRSGHAFGLTSGLRVARQVGPSGPGGPAGGPPPRIVFLDNNVIAEIGRGNTAVAAALRKLAADPNVSLRISRGVYIETTRVTGNMRAARIALIKKLNIQIVEGSLEGRAALYGDYASSSEFPTHGQGKITGSEKATLEDLPHLAETRAASPDAELWTFDGPTRTNAGRLKVIIAKPESDIPIYKNVPDNYTNVLKLVPEVTEADVAAAAGTHPAGTAEPAKPQVEGANPANPDPKAPPEQAGPGTAKGGDPSSTTPVRVGTKIEVKSAVKAPDGSTVSEVEYVFGEGLEQLNHGAPAGSAIPARMVIRVTQNAEGAITAVESLSGEPAALVEALVQQTLASELAAAAGGGAEGAAAGASRLAILSKGLKIGGWAAFVVITGYQLFKATPAQRPRVLAQAAGGLAGGAVTGFFVCNVLLDFETLGWGVLICGLAAGGGGGYLGSEAAGEVYDEATATDLSRALHRLDSRSRNERVLFNIIVGNLSYSSGCIDAGFVNGYLSAIPPNLQDKEVILLAGQLAKASGAAPAPGGAAQTPSADKKGSSHGFPSFERKKGTVCPSCHGRSQESLQPGIKPFDQKEYDAVMAAPTCKAVLGAAMAALRTAIIQLPPQRTTIGAYPQHAASPQKAEPPPDPNAHATPPGVHFSPTPHGFPSIEEQQGRPCPNCHGGTYDSKGRDWLQGSKLSGGGSGPITDADRKMLQDWIEADKK